jgi:hypothetical protein
LNVNRFEPLTYAGKSWRQRVFAAVTPGNEPLRARTDWFSPNRLWVVAWNTGAVYSPDGRVIQFDNGVIWRKCYYFHHHWQLQPSDPIKVERKPERKRKIAKHRAAPWFLVAQRPQFGWYGRSFW